jgi:integrase
MQNIPQSEALVSAPLQAVSFVSGDGAATGSTISVAAFVHKKFIPDHVELKSPAGRTHYHAILKHLITPERVDCFFASDSKLPNARLKAVQGWPYLDDVLLCDLTPAHVRQLVLSASLRGYSRQTVKHIRCVLGAIVKHAKKERMFDGENPISEVELPPASPTRSHELTVLQAKKLLKSMQYPEREIALLTISTGMNISEVCALQWKHINLTRKTVRSDEDPIQCESCIVKKQWTVDRIIDLAGKKVRVVELPSSLVQVLLQLKRSRRIVDQDQFLIATAEGHAMRPADTLIMCLKPIGQRMGMPWISWQILRRAHQSLLSELRTRLTNELVLSTTSLDDEELR